MVEWTELNYALMISQGAGERKPSVSRCLKSDRSWNLYTGVIPNYTQKKGHHLLMMFHIVTDVSDPVSTLGLVKTFPLFNSHQFSNSS